MNPLRMGCDISKDPATRSKHSHLHSNQGVSSEQCLEAPSRSRDVSFTHSSSCNSDIHMYWKWALTISTEPDVANSSLPTQLAAN